MYQIQVLYAHPEDTAASDKHYHDVHAKLAAAIPGITRYTASWCAAGPDGAAPPYYVIATLEADSQDAMDAAMGSPEGQAATTDLGTFATAGAAIVTGTAEQYV